jgi:hypothetical protein
MRTYSVSLGDSVINVNAESFNQAGDYVSFYADKQAIALVRLGLGDAVIERHDTERPKLVLDKRAVYYGPHACDCCGVLIAKMGREWGGTAYTYPEGPIYPNTEWVLHSCFAEPSPECAPSKTR